MAAIKRVGSGAALLLDDGESLDFTASIQPERALPPQDAGPLGTHRKRRYILYAPHHSVTALISEDSIIRSARMIFRVLKAETYRLSGAPLYRRAVMEVISDE
jgi:hypothetical protein